MIFHQETVVGMSLKLVLPHMNLQEHQSVLKNSSLPGASQDPKSRHSD